jgi:PAS domain S-box-containing protein
VTVPFAREILIVEDSPTQAEMLRQLLTGVGHEVRAARNGEEALAQLAERAPALVITDIVMPRMDGYELCRAIKRDPELRRIPVILLTSLASPKDVLNGLTAGADNFIRKPYEADYLLARVTHILTNLELRKREHMQLGMEISFLGERHFITSDRQQIVDFLLSSFEEAVHLNGELTRSYRSLDGLYRIAEALNRCTTEREVTREALDRALDLPGVRAAWMLIHDRGDRLRLADVRACDGVALDRRGLEGDSLCRRRVAATGARDAVNLPGCECGDHATVPLWAGKRLVGVLNVLGADGDFGEEDLRTLNGVGNQVAAALERAQLQEYLERRVEERTAALTAEVRARGRAEEALRAHAAIVESSDDGMVRLTTSGDVVTWNPGAERMYGWSAEEMVGRASDRLQPPDRVEEMAEVRRRVLAGQSVQGHETVRVTRDGDEVHVSLTVSPVRDGGGGVAGIAEISRDITARRELERQFLQAQKMQSVGRLAGGIAHDFNNLMTAVIGFSDLTLARLGREDPLRGNLEAIKGSGERAAALTQQLLAFGRRQVLQPEVLDLNTVVAEMQAMLERVIGEDVRLVTRLPDDLWPVDLDRSRLEQVVMNLAVNARDAMPDGGLLTIETANRELEPDFVALHIGVQPGRYVVLTVTDTGIGMDAETRAQIFEPFFTTKEAHGTGLGLATVFGIVKQSGGDVSVYSELGHGTTFRIYLPRTDKVEHVAAAEPAAAAAGGAETVLVLEDEEGVRELARLILGAAGYDVLVAAEPEEALTVSDRRPDIALLVTDMILPGMTGRQVADRLRAGRPDLRVLYMSGYPGDAIADRGLLEPDAPLVAKPFSSEALRAKVRELLDA